MKHVLELSKSIMAKCGGLPKVIDVVAKHYNMSYEPYSTLKDINDNFMQILEGFHSLRGLFSWTQSYLETCKDDMKPCIFYLPVFPIGHIIRLKRLLWRWIAEGYIRPDTSGHMLLSELWECSMFQLQESSKPVKIQVNGFFHEYINSRPMEDNLVFALEGPCSMQSQRARGQHLTVRDNWDRDMNVFGSTDFSRLRSLTVFGECRPFMFDPSKIKMRYVRVLDLEDASGVTNDDLKHIVEVFPRLKFFSLRGCRKITHLPKSLGRLRQLQTLDVRHTSIATLPKAILKLQKLQYVRAGTIHSAPWDKGGTMVQLPYQTRRPEEIISTSVPAEDTAAIVAAAPSAPAEDATTVAATPSSAASEDATTIERGPLSPAEVTTAVAAAPWVQTEDSTTVAPAASAPEEDARTGTTAAPAEGATIVAARWTSAEDATTVAAAATAPAEDRTTVATSPLAPVENATTISPEQADDSSVSAAAPSSMPHALLPSWLSNLCCRRSRHDNSHHGVEVPAGIGKLFALQTLGIVNVGPGNKAVILKELHKLTQLRRLGVCGINMHNIRDFFSAISGLKHLQRLSVRLDKSIDGLFACLDHSIPSPPETLDSLKLHGHVRILPSCSWVKNFANVPKLDLEVTLQEQHDMQVILDQLIHQDSISYMKRLCIKPIQDGELRIGINDERNFVGLLHEVLEIVCTTNLQATIDNIGAVRVLRVHCSSGSSLQLSGLQAIGYLKEVWLKGSCSDALKQDMQRQLAKHKDKPVFKVLQQPSS
jgi:hypothetical protein